MLLLLTRGEGGGRVFYAKLYTVYSIDKKKNPANVFNKGLATEAKKKNGGKELLPSL